MSDPQICHGCLLPMLTEAQRQGDEDEPEYSYCDDGDTCTAIFHTRKRRERAESVPNPHTEGATNVSD
jgi:hypothetical protein